MRSRRRFSAEFKAKIALEAHPDARRLPVPGPNAALSLQNHFRRSEHWVVRGTAEVTIGSEIRTITENESIHIPIGSVHRLANPGTMPLELIEVQVGDYLGEDDIERLTDQYGRS